MDMEDKAGRFAQMKTIIGSEKLLIKKPFLKEKCLCVIHQRSCLF